MGRLIDADKLRDKLQAEIDKVNPPFDGVFGSIRCGVRLARNMVEDEPTVDAESLITQHEDIGYERGYRDGYAEALEVTDDAEPVRHGHWIDGNDEIFIREGSGEYVHITTEVCSNCKELIIHAWTFGYVKYHYCPNCGAKMEGGKE